MGTEQGGNSMTQYPDGKWEIHTVEPYRFHIVALESDWAIPLVAGGMTHGTAEYIVGLHNGLAPAARKALAVLRDVEWVHDNGYSDDFCPFCAYLRAAHDPDCALAEAIVTLEGVL